MSKMKEKNRERLEERYTESIVESLLSDDKALRDFIGAWVGNLSNKELLDFHKESVGR